MKLIAFLILVSTAFAGDDFDSLVRAMESNYGDETPSHSSSWEWRTSS